MAALRIVGSVVLFVVSVVLANAAVVVGSWAITHLGSGLDVLVVLGVPALVFVLPGLVVRWLTKPPQKKGEPPSPVRELSSVFIIFPRSR